MQTAKKLETRLDHPTRERARQASHIEDVDGVEIVAYDELGAMLEDLEYIPAEAEGLIGKGIDLIGEQWYGRYGLPRGIQGFQKFALEHWQDGHDTAAELRGRIDASELPEPKQRIRRRRWSDSDGDSICIDRLRAGQDYWRKTERENATGPQTVCILNDWGTRGDKTAEAAQWRGIVSTVLTLMLEEAGFRVELWAGRLANSSVSKVYKDGTGLFRAVCIKRAGDRLDEGQIVNTLSPWFYRSIGLVMQTLSRHRADVEGMGVTQPLAQHETTATEYAERCGIINPLIVSNVWTESDAVALLKKHLQSFA